MKFATAVFGIVLALVIIMVSSNAFAQDRSKPRMKCEDRFVQMDTDKDGKVTLKEFMAVKHPKGNPEKLFKLRDSNGDGFLSKEEFCAKPDRGNGKGMKQKNS